MIDAETIGAAIRTNRKRAGMSQRQLAKASGVPMGCIYHYEHGKRLPGIYNAISVADALGISLDEMIGREVPE